MKKNLTTRQITTRFDYFWASSPKQRQWRIKRGEDGAAVKIARCSKPISNFGNRKK